MLNLRKIIQQIANSIIRVEVQYLLLTCTII